MRCSICYTLYSSVLLRQLSHHHLQCQYLTRTLPSQEVGRLFCPRCGNATVEKVEVVIGQDGQEQYGVRKKHILRGTRFSLPKPRVSALNFVGQWMNTLVLLKICD